MSKTPSALDLAPEELECLKTLAQAPWFSVRAEGVFEWLDKKTIRTSTVAIRSSEAFLLSSKDIQLSEHREAFRLQVEKAGYGPRAEGEILEIAGSSEAWLSNIGLIPRPLSIDLIWNYYDYQILRRDFSRTFGVTVPDTFLATGTGGRLLVTQDQAPMWLAVTADPERIEEVLARCQRSTRIS